MSQPARWLWGLIPLGLLWGAGNLALDTAIERDVGLRAEQAVAAVAGTTPGARPVVAQVDGRDVTIGGEVLSSDGANKAMARLHGEFGVRRTLGGLSQVVAQKPYSWFASRQSDSVTLGGFVPDLDTAAANMAVASAALPGLRIDDRQTVAFGAPEGFAAMAVAMLAELPKLASGRVALDDGRFCIEGKAASSDSFLALEAAVAQAQRPGFRSVKCDIEPPTVAPYRWSAEHEAGAALVMRGFYPDQDARKQMLAAARQAFGAGAALRDETKPALGAPSAFLVKVTRALGDLARLRQGKAEIDGENYALTGKGPETYEACQALRLQIAQLDGPDSVARAVIECPPMPLPSVPVVVPMPEVPGLILHDVLPASPKPQGSASAPAPAPATPQNPVPPPASTPPASTPVVPPRVVASVPLEWSAARSDSGLRLNGKLPDEAARTNLLATVRGLFGDTAVDDRMTVEPALRSDLDLPASTAFALEALSKLRTGSVSIRDKAFAIAGEAADAASLAALRDLFARNAPAGLALAAMPESVVVRPYGLSLSADRTGLRLSGYLPDRTAQAALRALVADSPLKDRFEDATTLIPGAPAGFAEAARAVLSDLLRLDLGSASIVDDRVTLRGLTCRDLIRSEIETSAATGLPAGYKADAVVSLRQTGCVVDPPASCQNDLDGLTKSNTVLFGQGTSVVELDATTERVIGEAATILKKCPGSPVVIEGHANRDGERRGFDNMDLSLRRALRVRDELARRGIETGQLAVKGYGSTRPLVPHEAPEARAMNRRVQFTVAK
ncbi:outer membrane protein OmpA-like peptidoglycan-associated protein [Bosea sp. AK1]|uniref:OmpA family protein n=1 Tax=Bosea sp. AK1 TaxID=2587160 RepID=UPI001152E022|nr:OmpA family protein [Bosea sp. AK1]TQI76478.1 outer membrane protein OmpA-like peptidoglycan-associated protein [Bosea sp. AK1]